MHCEIGKAEVCESHGSTASGWWLQNSDESQVADTVAECDGRVVSEKNILKK